VYIKIISVIPYNQQSPEQDIYIYIKHALPSLRLFDRSGGGVLKGPEFPKVFYLITTYKDKYKIQWRPAKC